MRTSSSALGVSLIASYLIFTTTTNSQLLPFALEIPRPSALSSQQQQSPKQQHRQPHQLQLPMNSNPGIQLPPASSDSSADTNDPPHPFADTVGLLDVIGQQHSISIFAGFTRDVSSVASRLRYGAGRPKEGGNSTILAPLNTAMRALPRKPWEDAADYTALGTEAYAGDDGKSRANANLRRFAEAHVLVVERPGAWKEGVKVPNMLGQMVWWEKNAEGKIVVQPGEVEVEKVESRVANGEIWSLKGVVDYTSAAEKTKE